MRVRVLPVAVLWLVSYTGLGAQSKTADALAAGQILYARSGCAVCHGATGRGDGAAAAALKPRPQDLSDGLRMKDMTDAFLFEIIKSGGPAIKKSAAMPPAPKSMTDDDINNLVVYIRSLAPKSP